MFLQFNTLYHIYNHANGDDNLFREEKNYSFFLEKYHQHIDPIAETIAWCLMPNHFHLLVKIRSEKEIVDNFSSSASANFSKVLNFRKVEVLEEEKLKFLSKQFSIFFSSYTQAFNKMYNRRGSLFIKNFKRKQIANQDYLRNIVLYIHLNPVKHGFTKAASDWRWTSYQAFFDESSDLAKSLFDDKAGYKDTHLGKQRLFKEYELLERDLT
ncbi:MAG: hypothetical protein LC101_11690 [Flavobacteriales bacterium]|nr:hypothetical protein [Flavobacteriales bacterium]